MGIFRMPSLGADMEAGTLVEWLKRPGDAVARGDIIAVVETQKGAIEIESFESGVLDRHLQPVGVTVPVGTELAVIRGESTEPEPGPVPSDKQLIGTAALPGAPIVETQQRPPPRPGMPKASPAARQLAAEKGIDLAAVIGSGPEGAILYVDVENALLGARPVAKPARPEMPTAGKPSSVEAMRAAIAAAMTRSKREIPHYYVGQAADVTRATDWMATENARRLPAERLVFSCLLMKAVALALEQYPEFNGHAQNGILTPANGIHVGLAVALRGGGLVAPAIHGTATLSLDALMAKLRDLTNRVRSGRFRQSELADPTITLTSLGERGVDWVQPIIYPPQVAIIGAGTPAQRPWIVDGQLAIRHVCELTLAADHRISDGHRGALLLRAVVEHLSQPEKL